MSFLTPLALGLAAFAIPIILLYMLRLRRREVPVSSTLLWERLMRDREANAPWQRLRRNLLLLLQLLILAALVLALARPFREVPALIEGSVVVLLDASASMNATDIAPDRFEQARDLAREMIQQLGEGSVMTLIEVGAVPRVLIAGAEDKSALRDALDQARPSMEAADWESALTLAAASVQGSTLPSIAVISDGGLPDDLPGVPGEMRYIPVGAEAANLAITALSARPVPGAGPELFAQITNFGAEDMDVIFSVELDDSGEIYFAASYTVLAGASLDVNLADLPNPTRIYARLTRPAASAQPDYLAVDDEAWAVYMPPGAGRILLVTEGNVYIEELLRALPDVQSYRAAPGQPLPEEPFDLYIFDRSAPASLPMGDLLIIGPQESTALFEVTGTSSETGLLQVEESDPRMAFVTLNNLHVADIVQLSGVEWATPLAKVEGGPLILAGEAAGRQVAILAFDLYRSDLPLQIAWPVLMANLLEWFAPSRVVGAPDVLRPTDSVLIRPQLAADAVEVMRPDGAARALAVGEQAINFSETELPGHYLVTVFRDGAVLQAEWFAVNLFSAAESAIAPRPAITVGASTLEEAEREALGQQEFWPVVALVGLLVLAVEWYFYHRGMQLPSRPSPLRRPGR
ncbi:MAG: VWA domain-containing protein [Anaerolineae bacterium]|nr:VWA domain-containing protein [Anaerolineae bacterium]